MDERSSHGDTGIELPDEEKRADRVAKAKKSIENTQWGTAPLAETELILREYMDEHTKLIQLERTIPDITKANFTAFGAVLLVGSSSFFVHIANGQSVAFVACLIVAFISLASSVLVVFYYKSVVAYSKKISILRKAAWRRRPFVWLDVKYDSEEILEKFQEANRLGIVEFMKYRYVMKTINLIPLWIVLAILFLVIFQHRNILFPPSALP